MIWSAAITALALVIGVVLGFVSNMIATDRQAKQQAVREDVAATRDYARRADEHYRPHFDTVLAAARSINLACQERSADLGDIDALDRCIDHLECSPLTRPVAFAATDLRNAALGYRTELQTQRVLHDQMPAPGLGHSLNPKAGQAIVEHSEKQLEPARDAALAATYTVREAVKAVVARLETDQEMPTAGSAQGSRAVGTKPRRK
jgi:hypothetical protein